MNSASLLVRKVILYVELGGGRDSGTGSLACGLGGAPRDWSPCASAPFLLPTLCLLPALQVSGEPTQMLLSPGSKDGQIHTIETVPHKLCISVV